MFFLGGSNILIINTKRDKPGAIILNQDLKNYLRLSYLIFQKIARCFPGQTDNVLCMFCIVKEERNRIREDMDNAHACILVKLLSRPDVYSIMEKMTIDSIITILETLSVCNNSKDFAAVIRE